MQLQTIFDALTFGELSNLGMGGLELGGVQTTRYKQVVNHINLGMTALHKRFNLKEEILTLALQPGLTQYILKDTHAVSGFSSISPRTILDSTAKPFQNNIVKIVSVTTDSGFEMALNNGADLYSVFTPSFNILNIPIELVTAPQPADFPTDLITTMLKVAYQANAIPITEDNGLDDPEGTEVELPDSYLMALLYFVGNRANTPTGAGQNEANLGGIYYKKFLDECKRIEDDGLDVDQGAQSTRLKAKGWV